MAGLFGFDPTPNFSVVNVARTQLANLTGNEKPGYNAPSNPGSTPDPNAPRLSVGVAQPGTLTNNQTQQVLDATTDRPNVSGGVDLGGSGGSSTGGLSAAERAAIEAEWAQVNKYYSGLLGTIDPRRKAAQESVNREVDAESKSLTNERDAAYENLDREGEKLEDQYGRGLSSLGENVRNTLQGQYNVLGMNGAGDSSAADMLGIAVAGMQNDATEQMKTDLNDQMTDININRKQVSTKFDDELRKLSNFKQSKYQEIKDTFDTERNNILNKLNVNDTDKMKALASAGAIAQSQIDAVDTTINNRLSSIVSSYKNIDAPKVSLSDVPEYKSTRIAPGAVDSTITTNTPELTSDQAMQAISGRRDDDKKRPQLF